MSRNGDRPRIHLAYEFVDGPWGGANQFLKALRDKLRAMGLYAESPEESNVILMNSYHVNSTKTIKEVLRFKKKGGNSPRVMHRIDGPFSLVRGRPDVSDVAVRHVNLISDGTVFQTNWIKENAKLSPKSRGLPSRVIGNAPDEKIFYQKTTSSDPSEKTKLLYTSWSTGMNKGFDTLKWIDENMDWDKYSMTFVGNSPTVFENICMRPPLGSEALAHEIRKHDIFISPARNEPSSNAILEALSCGLPVLAVNQGGSPELVGKSGELFDSPEEIPKLVKKISQNLSVYRAKIQIRTMDDVANDYVEFARELLRRPPRETSSVKIRAIEIIWASRVAQTIMKLQDLFSRLRD